MRRRWLEVTAVGAVLAALVVLLKWTAGTDDAQVSRAARTLWGEPDLLGLWANEYQIPLQWPTQFGTREFLTDAEVAERDKQAAATSTFSAAPRREGLNRTSPAPTTSASSRSGGRPADGRR